MGTKLKVGQTIEFESGERYVVRRVFDDNICDLKTTKPEFEWMPDFYPIYYSIKCENFKIVE